MKELLKLLPLALYVSVGVICLVMAFKCFFCRKYLPFHEKAANKPWNEIESPLKLVILFFLRLTGLGFLVMSILLMAFPIVNYFIPSTFYRCSVPFIGLIFCTGLFVNNYLLFKKTKANTPWKGSLYAMVIILTGIVISIFN